MKRILILAAVVLPFCVWGQQDLKPELIDGCKYLQAAMGNEAALGKTKLAVTYGNAQLMEHVVDEDGKKYLFKSWGHAYDFLERQGWVYFKDEKVRMNGVDIGIIILRSKE